MLELKQHLKLTQELRMTPQLQQAIKLLQLSRLELQNLVQQELNENPVLEQDTPDDPAGDDTELIQEVLDSGEPDPVPVDSDDFNYEKVIEQYEEFRPPQTPAVRQHDDAAPTYENRASAEDSLFEHLMWQLQMASFNFEERLVATELIGNIDDNGYLNQETFETVCGEVGVSLEFGELVLGRLQKFDPIGSGARSLRECLLIQAETYFPEHELLRSVITDHLNDLVGRAAAGLRKKLGISEEELRDVLGLISGLNPKPGREFASSPPEYVIPDVYVNKVGDEYVVSLNESGLPKLRISEYYRRILKDNANQQTKDFLRQKVRSAVWLVRSIYQRESTLKRVADAIFRFQKDFLDSGSEHLRPLVLRDVAEEVGMHESTISRVTTKKYAQTPQGLFELKYFFGARITADHGKDLSAQAIRERIRSLIAVEDPKKPLSDQAISDIFKRENINIARRTVAKYRMQLGLLSSSERMKAL